LNKVIEEAQKRFKASVDAEGSEREKRLDDIKFVRLGEQWPEAVKRDRERPGAERPMLTINRLFQFRNQVINEIRQNSPSIKFKQADGDGHEKAAAMREDLVRQIQQSSSADIAYDTATEWQVDTGLGYFRIVTDYASDDSFEQEIQIKRIPDPMKVYFDPDSTEPDGCDAKFAFVIEDYSKAEFEAIYPDIETAGWQEAGAGDASGWYSSDNVRVAEYFTLENKPRTLVMMGDGSTGWKDELPQEFHHAIAKERKSEQRVCKWYKIAGDQIIDETELPTSYIPVIPVIGSEVWIEGKRHLHGLTRHAKDPARLYNYMQSANTELLALAPRSPYIAATGQIEGYESEWQNANRLNISVLEYNPIDIVGNVLPAPRREPPPSTNPGFESAMMRSVDDIKATMGIYDASIGNREAEQSGKAILSQQRQASIANFHFQDNLTRSLKHAGKIINEMLVVYDTQRLLQVIGYDGTEKSVIVDPNAPQAYQEINGEEVYNLAKGKYAVVVDVGPTYASKKQEAAESQMQLAQTDPTLMQIAGDLIIKNMDWPGADEIAERKKAMLPPQIQAIVDKDKKDQADPQVTAQMSQMADQMEHMSQAMAELQRKAEGKEEELEVKRFEAQTKRLEVEHKIALESNSWFHTVASESVARTLETPNTGELEDQDEENEGMPQPPETVQTLSGDMQNE
jgi:hypothetical protein